MTERTKYCQCGRRLHYTIPALEALVNGLSDAYGEYVHVSSGGRVYVAQRHYIILHGIDGHEMARLGFREADTAQRG